MAGKFLGDNRHIWKGPRKHGIQTITGPSVRRFADCRNPPHHRHHHMSGPPKKVLDKQFCGL